jgi:hypothetical protein
MEDFKGRALGPQYEGDLFMGSARTFLEGGHRMSSRRILPTVSL